MVKNKIINNLKELLKYIKNIDELTNLLINKNID